MEADRRGVWLGTLEPERVLDRTQFALTMCERARLGLAIGFATAIPLILVDSAPDAVSAEWRPSVQTLFRTRADTGGAVLIAGRDPEAVCALAATVLTLRDGRLTVRTAERDQRSPARVAESDPVAERPPGTTGRYHG